MRGPLRPSGRVGTEEDMLLTNCVLGWYSMGDFSSDDDGMIGYIFHVDHGDLYTLSPRVVWSGQRRNACSSIPVSNVIDASILRQ